MLHDLLKNIKHKTRFFSLFPNLIIFILIWSLLLGLFGVASTALDGFQNTRITIMQAYKLWLKSAHNLQEADAMVIEGILNRTVVVLTEKFNRKLEYNVTLLKTYLNERKISQLKGDIDSFYKIDNQFIIIIDILDGYTLTEIHVFRSLFIFMILLCLAMSGVTIYQLNSYWRIFDEKQRQKAFISHLVAEKEKERIRLSREFHDVVAQDLALALRNNSLDLQQNMLIAQTLKTIRRICADLRPPILESLGLWSAIQQLCSQMSSKDFIVTCQILGSPKSPSNAESQLHIYRIIQEALNNVAKHAQSKTAAVKVLSSHPCVIITVDDEGVGLSNNSNYQCFGTTGMRERAELIGGTIRWQKNPVGIGSRVLLKIPYI